MEKPVIYTIGYKNLKLGRLTTIATELYALVVDIRGTVASDGPWGSVSLAKALGSDYHRMGDVLGNRGQMKHWSKGVDQLNALCERMSRPILMLCVCHQPMDCHRSKLAELLKAHKAPRYGEIVHLVDNEAIADDDLISAWREDEHPDYFEWKNGRDLAAHF